MIVESNFNLDNPASNNDDDISCKNNQRLKAVNYVRKKLHHICLTEL